MTTGPLWIILTSPITMATTYSSVEARSTSLSCSPWRADPPAEGESEIMGLRGLNLGLCVSSSTGDQALDCFQCACYQPLPEIFSSVQWTAWKDKATHTIQVLNISCLFASLAGSPYPKMPANTLTAILGSWRFHCQCKSLAWYVLWWECGNVCGIKLVSYLQAPPLKVVTYFAGNKLKLSRTRKAQ